MHTSSSTSTEVHVARHRKTGEFVILKAVARSQSRPVSVTAAAVLHAKLEHEHIARLHEIFDSERLVLVMEIVEGITLDFFMQSFGCRPDDAKQILQQAVGAVSYMHSAGVCHRDLRLSNIMLRATSDTSTQCCVKLIDLGTRPCRQAPHTQGQLRRRLCGAGALGLAANPEQAPPPPSSPLLLPEYSGKAVDVRALGVITHVLLTGTYPYTSEAAVVAARSPKHTLSIELPKGAPPPSLTSSGAC